MRSLLALGVLSMAYAQEYAIPCTTIDAAGLVGPSDCQFVAENKFSADSDTEVTATSVTLPPSVHTIGAYAFTGNNIESVAMPGVEEIGHFAFAGNALTSLSLPDDFSGSIPEHTFADNQLTSLTLPVGVTAIEQAAFKDNTLTSVHLPGVKVILQDAFAGNALTSVHLPGVEAIQDYAFEDNALTSVRLPQVQHVGHQAFKNNQLVSVFLPLVEYVGQQAFKNNQLVSVFLPQLAVIVSNAFDDNTREITGGSNRASLTSLVMPSGVQIQGDDGTTDTFAGLVSTDVPRIGGGDPWKVFLQPNTDLQDLHMSTILTQSWYWDCAGCVSSAQKAAAALASTSDGQGAMSDAWNAANLQCTA